MQGAFSTIRRVMGIMVSQKSDPELGAYDVPARPSALPSISPELAEYIASDENFTFSMYRRFAWLHSRVLLHAQEKIFHCQQYLEELEELDGKARKRDESASHESRGWLLKTIKEKLSGYGKRSPETKSSIVLSIPFRFINHADASFSTNFKAKRLSLPKRQRIPEPRTTYLH